MKTFRKFTSEIPLREKTVVLHNLHGFANSVEDKLAMAKAAKRRRLYIAWPGKYETHTFVTTGIEVAAALAPPKPAFKVGDLVRLIKCYSGPAVGTVGVVRRVGPNLAVEWGGFTGGHNLGGDSRTRSGGWVVPSDYVEAA